MKKTQVKGVVILFLAAFIWGTSFVAQSAGMEKTEAFTFNGIRMLLGAAFLLPFIAIKDTFDGKKEKKLPEQKKVGEYKACKAGLYLGYCTVYCK